jgi:hypothetical protein
MDIGKVMDFERIKSFLQNYIDTVVLPTSNSERDEHISLEVTHILKGSYQPPIIHVFINVKPHWTPRMSLNGVEKDISNFFKVFSVNNRIKIHWNKSPNLTKALAI